jgi:multicomponent K+:H+ antiporter subunit G
MNTSTATWADTLTALFVLLGALAALIGSFGLLRLGSFFQRVHAPTLGATVGTWGLTLATVLQASSVAGQLQLHAVLIPAFVALTAPVTTVFLMRAALFRGRLRRDPTIPLLRANDFKPPDDRT